jgi:O-antigen/teichoic acid export membrane protein
VIGKIFPLAELGFYTRAVQLQEFPVKSIANIFQRVAFPVFSSIQDENERLKKAVRKTLRTMAFITFLILLGLIAVADELIAVLLTEKWLQASGYFKLLCVIGLFYTFHIINSEILKTKGKSDWILKLEIITKIILITNIFLTWRWGIAAIILGQLITTVVALLIGSYYVWKLIGYSLWQQLKDIFVYLAISVLMYLVVVLISHTISDSLISLITMILAGVTFYLGTAMILNLDEINEMRIILVKQK